MANSITNVGFTDYGSEQADIERRRQYAQALQQQAMTPMGGAESVGGWAIRKSPFEGLGKMLQAYSGRKGQEAATEEQKQLGQRYQSDLGQTLMRAQQAGAGTPAGKMEGTEFGPAFDTPAVAPDRQAMARILMGHPETRALGAAQMQKDMDMQARKASLADIMGGPAPMGNGGASVMAPNSGQGAFAGLPPQVVALMTSGDPELVKLGTTLMEANKGIAQRPGAPVVNPFTGAVIAQPTPAVPAGIGLQVGPGGPAAYPVPGAQGAMGALTASQAGATEAGKAPYQLTNVNTPGAPTLMTHEQAIQAATGQPMPQPGAQQPPVNARQPVVPGTNMSNPPDSVVPPEDRAAFNAAIPQRNMVQQPQQRTPGLRLQDSGDQRAQVEMGEGLGKRYNSIQDAGFSANQKMQKFERLGNLLGQIDTGKLTPAGTEIAAWAKAAGFNISDKLDNAQAAKAMSNEMALELRNPAGGAGMPGAMSDADRNYLQSLIASIDKTPGANKLLLDGMTKLAQRDREVAQMARDYKKKNGSFDDGFYDELSRFSEANPLFRKPTATPGLPSGVRVTRLP